MLANVGDDDLKFTADGLELVDALAHLCELLLSNSHLDETILLPVGTATGAFEAGAHLGDFHRLRLDLCFEGLALGEGTADLGKFLDEVVKDFGVGQQDREVVGCKDALFEVVGADASEDLDGEIGNQSATWCELK